MKNYSLLFCFFTLLGGNYDGVLVAPEWHKVLFENDEMRVLWGETKPGEKEKLHMHYCPSLMIILSGAEFEIEYADGTKEIGHWGVGKYDLPPDEQPASYTNIGNTSFIAIRIEYKDREIMKASK